MAPSAGVVGAVEPLTEAPGARLSIGIVSRSPLVVQLTLWGKMQRISANVYPIRGQGRTAASILQGLGFDVFRIDATMCIEGPPELWREVFGVTGPEVEALAIPDDLAGLLDRVVFRSSRI